MAQAKVTMLTPGRALIEQTLAGNGNYAPHSFEVGTTAGFTPLPGDIVVRGTKVFTGPSYLMQARLMSDGAVRYLMTLPEGAGPFNVGNIVMYVEGSGTGPVPFAMIASPIPLPKRISLVDETDFGYSAPGNRFVIAITLKSVVVDSGADADITVTVQIMAPDYANLATFGRVNEIPDPSVTPWNQFVVQQLDATNGPALVSKRGSSFWAIPFFRNLRHPRYGVLSGGSKGDGYQESRAPWIWGGLLKTPNTEFTHNVGGRPLSLTGAGPNQVGGLRLKRR